MLPLTVADQLRQAISDGEYEPGQRFNEVRLAAELAVSRNTLRESLSLLVSDGLCERIPNRGVFLATPSAATLGDVFRARAAIEPAAILWGEDLPVDALEDNVRAARAALDAGELGDVGRLNQKFHLRIVAATGSSTLESTMSRIAAYMRLSFLTVIKHVPDFHAPYIDNNAAVVAALRDNGREDAAHLLHGQMLHTFDEVDALLREHDPAYLS
ncbi:GntR family transcriptional regulator [Corynebacterium sp. LK2510]|uniref:GntR family transcriptional regulator n=1 Tax=Corynebacterium sp. LK2510 TaxID=3110472 RepID=UPI0034CEE5B7